MADDQKPQDTQAPVSPSLPSDPSAIPEDQSASSDANRPISTIPADSVPESLPSEQSATSTTDRPDSPKMADSPPSQTEPIVPPVEQPLASVDQTIEEISLTPPEDNRPISPNLADSVQSSPPQSTSIDNRPDSFIPSQAEGTISTDSHPPQEEVVPAPAESPPISVDQPVAEVNSVPSDANRPDTTNLADSSSISDSPMETPTEKASFQSIPTETSSPNQAPIPSSPPLSDSDLSTPSHFSNIPDVSISFTDNQVSHVQSEPSDNTSGISAPQQVGESASFKPEPLEGPQEAPLANPDSEKTSPKSFGDLLSGNTPSSNTPQPQVVEQPSMPPEQPNTTTTFGDLIKDIEITPPSIPKAQRPVEQPLQTQSSQSPLPAGASVKVDQSPPITPTPVINQEEVEKQTSQKLKDEQRTRRILANQARAKRKVDNLSKIMGLARTREKINNQDIRDLLHVSQSTVTEYLKELVASGKLRKEGMAKATFYII